MPQNLRFQGQYLDRESGLHYNLFRYYDPAGGRFTQSAPIGLAGGLNIYTYGPNPLSYIDPLGLTTCSVETLRNARRNNYAISPSQRQGIIDSIDNNRLKSIFSELYRPGANIPDGGTAASILHTKITGQLVGGSDHIAKGVSYLEALKKLTSGTGKYKGEVLSSSDRSLASYIMSDLNEALRLIP